MSPSVIRTSIALAVLLTASIVHAQSDLAVLGVDSAGVAGDWQALTINGSVQVVVQNAGGLTTPVAPLVIFEDRDGSGGLSAGDAVLGEADVPPLGLLATVQISVDVSGPVLFRGNVIKAVVDPDNLNSESAARRANNIGSDLLLCDTPIEPNPFTIELKAEWPAPKQALSFPDSLNVLTTPAVVDLDGDGAVEIVFVSTDATDGSALRPGVLRVARGLDLSEVFSVNDPAHVVNATAPLAVGDIDGDGRPEIIAVRSDGRRLIAFEHDGTFKWETPDLELIRAGGPALADLNGDGVVEIVIGRQIVRNNGTLAATGTGGSGKGFAGPLAVVADLNRDGTPEVVAGNTAYTWNGAALNILWQAPVNDGLTAVADFNLDGWPEVVLSGSQTVRLLSGQTGAQLWEQAIPLGGPGGPPVVADVDSDGLPEIGVAGSFRFVVFNGDGSILWQEAVSDISSGVAAGTVFDFNGDGAAEIAYRDEGKFYVFSGGPDAFPRVLYEAPISSCTWYENPVVVDLDNDGAADLIVPANNNCSFGTERGLKIYHGGPSPWVAARKIWNQHSYHVTNVNDDGTIPAVESASWLTPDADPYNSYRINTWQATPVSNPLPDLTASRLLLDCDAGTLTVRIGNGGGAAAPGELALALYGAAPQPGSLPLDVQFVLSPIASGQFVDVVFDVPAAFDLAVETLYVVADDSGGLNGLVDECDESNNAFSGSAATICPLAFTSFPADITVQFGVDVADPANTGGSAAAGDACGSDVEADFADDVAVIAPPFPVVVQRTWSAASTCGLSISRVQRITVVAAPPPPPPPLDLECAAQVSAIQVSGATGVPVDELELPVSFTGGLPPVIIMDDRPADVYPLGETLVIFTAMDAAGSIAECTTRVVVTDSGDTGQPAPDPDVNAEERRITRTTTTHCGFVGLFPIFACGAGLASMRRWVARGR